MGAILFFGIIINIFIITIGLHFTNTWIVTSLMLFAGIELLAWDWYRLKAVFEFYPSEYEIANYKLPSLQWQVAGLVAFISIISILFLAKKISGR